MSKRIPNVLAKRYIAVEAELHELQDTRSSLKARLDKLVAKGYTHPLLEIIPCERASIPWKDLCDELVKQFMTKHEAKLWYKKTKKRFPAKPIAPTIRAAKKQKKQKDGE